MTLNDIVKKTIESQLKQADVEIFCEQERTTTEAFCDEFARHIAIGYIGGQFSYESADSGIAGLHFHFFQGTGANGYRALSFELDMNLIIIVALLCWLPVAVAQLYVRQLEP